ADLRLIANREIKVCNSLRPRCIPQLCDSAPFMPRKPVLGVRIHSAPPDSLDYRRIFALLLLKQAKTPGFRDNSSTNRTEENRVLSTRSVSSRRFSGVPMGSPTLAMAEANGWRRKTACSENPT